MEAQKQKSLVFTDDDTYTKIFNQNLTPECLIFVHKSFREVLKQLRSIRKKVRKKELSVSKGVSSILPRAKIHLYYAYKELLAKKDLDFGPDGTIPDTTLNEFNEKNTIFLLNVMVKSIKKLYGKKPMDFVNVFKKRELASIVKETI